MKLICLFLALSLLACSQPKDQTTADEDAGVVKVDTASAQAERKVTPADSIAEPTTYANERFRNVAVQQVGEHTYRVQGQAQVFEAAFSWVVEDGHHELKEGHEMTEAGAPAWGDFSFTVEIQKQRPNSTLTLILYEASAKDGSRQHLLPIPLG